MSPSLKIIPPAALVAMDTKTGQYPIRIDLAYAHDRPPNQFGVIYRPEARLWLHEDMAWIVCRASEMIQARFGFLTVLYDGLRTVEAQARMIEAPIIKANPHWINGPVTLLSKPGTGAHPRGMAIDIGLLNPDGTLVDMGTGFDYFAENPAADYNPAHRHYVNLKAHHAANRKILDEAMIEGADEAGLPMFLLPQEWWDFRFPPDYFNQFAPIHDSDLPPDMRMTD
jgi:D-alanyl-D-alanine dipeptidase